MTTVSHSSERLFNGAHLRATGYGADAPGIVVTFDYYKQDKKGFPALPTTRDEPTPNTGMIKITTASNDWFLNSDLEPMSAVLSSVLASKSKVFGVGSSMGGYGALLMSDLIGLQRVMLISPQYSIFPEHAPWETRYLNEAAALDPMADDLSARVRSDLKGLILFDPRQKADHLHARAISALAQGIDCAAMPFGGHPATRNILGSGGYWRLLKRFVANDLSRIDACAEHKRCRTSSSEYVRRLQKYLRTREDRKF